jgi:hypothetical protein
MAKEIDTSRSLSGGDIELGLEMASGAFSGLSVIHKFGADQAVGTSFEPITSGGVWPTPQVSGATALRIKAGGNANDTAAGTGAREVTIVGLDETGAEVTEALATAGASASSATTATFVRIYRAYVSSSGTYATASAGSHSADIVIENSAGTADWATINSTPFPMSQSEIGCYSVPLGCTAYISNIVVNVDSTKAATILGFKRENILETAAPYTAMRSFLELGGVSGEEFITPKIPYGPFPALTDIGFMAKLTSGSGEVDVDFEILLVKD